MHKPLLNVLTEKSVSDSFLGQFPPETKIMLHNILVEFVGKPDIYGGIFETKNMAGIYYGGLYPDQYFPTDYPKIIALTVTGDFFFLIKGEKPVHLLELTTTKIAEMTDILIKKWKELDKYNLLVLAYVPKKGMFLDWSTPKETSTIIKVLALIRRQIGFRFTSFVIRENTRQIQLIGNGDIKEVICTIFRRDDEILLAGGPEVLLKLSHITFWQVHNFVNTRLAEMPLIPDPVEENENYEPKVVSIARSIFGSEFLDGAVVTREREGSRVSEYIYDGYYEPNPLYDKYRRDEYDQEEYKVDHFLKDEEERYKELFNWALEDDYLC